MHSKLVLSFGCRQIVASIECSLILYIQSNCSPNTYRKKKAKTNKGIYAFKLNGSFESTQTVAKDWMQHHALHPMCFKYVSSMSSILASLPPYLLFYYRTWVVSFCVNLEIMSSDFYSTVVTMDYGSTVGLTNFKYFQT